MSDFDFEELDKAVSGVLQGDDASQVNRNSAPSGFVSDASSNSAITPVATVSSAPTPAPAAAAPAARRSSGRFMDMVHPSSDMRNLGVQNASATSAGQRVAPLGVQTMASTGGASLPNSWPPAAGVGVAGVSDVSEVPEVVEPPIGSPFLPDAKVEKRPLGSFASADDAAFEGFQPEPLASITPVSQEPVQPIPEPPSKALFEDSPAEAFPALPTPPEVATLADAPDEPLIDAPAPQAAFDNVEVESLLEEEEPQESLASSNEPPITTPATDTADTVPQNPVGTAEEPLQGPFQGAPQSLSQGPLQESSQEQAVATAPPVVSENTPAGPASITQQYAEKPSSTGETGAIYDTESYHKPLAPAAKKHSGAWMMLWILLLVLAGAAAGAAFFIYVLPML